MIFKRNKTDDLGGLRMKNFKKSYFKFILLSAILCLCIYPVFATAGSSEDPIISLSYLNQRLSLINDTLMARVEELEKKIEMLEKNNGSTPSTETEMAKFTVLSLDKGNRLILGSSTEVILRSGKATAMANIYGEGLTDITGGKDMKDKEQVEKNHLMIAPRDDGRGILCETEVFVMIKGIYKIMK